MKYNKTLICHSCSTGFKQFREQELLKHDHDENLCPRCFYTEELYSSFQWMSMFDDVAKAFKNPLNRFKFIHKSFEEKIHICSQMMDEKIITFNIGTHN